MKTLPQTYQHQDAEKKWQHYWAEKEVYAWDESQPRDNSFVIDTPPPTVSGLLHMGHIFSYTQADFVARYQRMKGKTVFYPMGFDDNGLPTERLVEKVKKVRASDMSREEFIVLCEGVAEEARTEFRRLFTSVALSVDWKQEYHTISDQSRQISQLSFLDLFHKNRIYQKEQPFLWDIQDQTAIAQAEVEDKDLESFENYIWFGLVDEKDFNEGRQRSWEELEKIPVMTTRPELLLACVGLICSKEEEKKFEGKLAVTPFFNAVVPIHSSEKVDKEKGTGYVMCCTFGDDTDIEWWREFSLATRIILQKWGQVIVTGYSDVLLRVNDENAPEDIDREEVLRTSEKSIGFGTDSASEITPNNCLDFMATCNAINQFNGVTFKGGKARKRMVELLENNNLTVKEKVPITHAVKCAERSGQELNYIITNQWFVKLLDQKFALKEKAAECNWYPEYMRIRMDQWIDGLSWDWCISRQRYFGVPIPVWYIKKDGEENLITHIASREELPVNPISDAPEGYEYIEVSGVSSSGRQGHLQNWYKAKNISTGEIVKIKPEADVMDTWATSSVSPQLNSRAINKDYAVDYDRHQKLFPADLRPQAHEIIRTWAFYTVVKAHLHEDTIPWKNLMISGWCLASDKTKMSKSKGNVVTPVDLIEEKGTDVVRYWASTSRLGTDTAFSEDVLKIGKKLVNKVWNASKFAAIHLDKITQAPVSAVADIEQGVICETLDKWVLTRLHRAIAKATEEFEKFEYCNARVAVEDFFWNDFCDNYLELIKKRAYNEDGSDNAGQQSAAHTVYHCLEAVLRLFAPFIPHVTEELYSHIFDGHFEKTGSIHARGTWPDARLFPLDESAEKGGKATVSVLDVVRKIKAEQGVSIKWPIETLLISGEEQILSGCVDDLKHVTNSQSVQLGNDSLADSLETECGAFHVSARLAKESDAA